jgi:hypothetical protein
MRPCAMPTPPLPPGVYPRRFIDARGTQRPPAASQHTALLSRAPVYWRRSAACPARLSKRGSPRNRKRARDPSGLELHARGDDHHLGRLSERLAMRMRLHFMRDILPRRASESIRVEQPPPPSAPAIEHVGTSVAAFVGPTTTGPREAPVHVTSVVEYERTFGGLDADDTGLRFGSSLRTVAGARG